MNDLNQLIMSINNFLWGWPLVIFILAAGLVLTLQLNFIQFRFFVDAWRLLFKPEKKTGGSADMSPFQAFLNALSASIGNGSLAGMATAVYSGGPGVVVWVFIFGLVGMAIRYSEVYLSTIFGVRQLKTGPIGGPMMYLSKVPGGTFLPYLYALFCLFLGFAGGCGMQSNSIRLGVVRILPVSPLVVAIVLFLFMLYVMFGGAKRIIWVSDRIVPLKVGVFFISAFLILMYHWQAIIPTLIFCIKAAFSVKAIAGGALGYTMQQAIRFGIARAVNASETGLGTAAVLFGGSSSTNPVKDGFMGMLSSFVSANLVCTLISFIIVASGVWNNGQTSTDLTISAYETVFGVFGGWIVTLLSISFGLGVLVTYAYICRSCWLFLTGGHFMWLFTALFCGITFWGALAKVDLVWNLVDFVNAGLILLNVFGILYLMPLIKKGFVDFQKTHGK